MYFIKRFLSFKFAVLFSCAIQAQVSFQTKQFKISFDQTGKLTELLARSLNKNYLLAGEASYLLSVKRNGSIINLGKLQWKKASSEIILS